MYEFYFRKMKFIIFVPYIIKPVPILASLIENQKGKYLFYTQFDEYNSNRSSD